MKLILSNGIDCREYMLENPELKDNCLVATVDDTNILDNWIDGVIYYKPFWVDAAIKAGKRVVVCPRPDEQHFSNKNFSIEIVGNKIIFKPHPKNLTNSYLGVLTN